MAGSIHGSELPEALRGRLEEALREACVRAGVDVSGRTAEVRCRLDHEGNLAWYEPMLIRVPASVLERGFDETG